MTGITPPQDPRLRLANGWPPPVPRTDPAHNRLDGPDPRPEPLERRRDPLSWRFLRFVVALGLIAAALAIDLEALWAIPLLFVLVVPFEKFFPRHQQKLRRPGLLTDLSFALSGPLLNAVGIVAAVIVGVLSLAWLPGLLVRPLVGMVPAPLVPLLGIALFDCAIYWTHRWYHEVPVLWRFHAVHHSTEHLDWVSGFRSHPFDGTLVAPAFVFLVAAGFSPEFTGILTIIQLVLGIFLHANVRWRLAPLHKLIITPEFHHWHHANEPGAVNSNYSVFLPAWDVMFGSYFMPRDRRPQRYGVSEAMPSDMIGQLRYPLRDIGNPLMIIGHPRRSIMAGARFVLLLASEMKRSAMHPRRRSPEDIPAHSIPREPAAS